MAFLTLELGEKLIAHQRPLFVVGHRCELAPKLREGDGRIDHYRLHGSEVLQGLVDPYRVEDAKGLFADIVAATRGAPEHLIEQDTAVHAAQKHQVADLRDIHAGGQQIHGHGWRRCRPA